MEGKKVEKVKLQAEIKELQRQHDLSEEERARHFKEYRNID
jgi:hypothetical protein